MEELAAWLTLHRAPGIGARTFYKLLQRFGSVSRIFSVGPAQLRELGLKDDTIRWLEQPDSRRIEADLDWLGKPGNQLIRLDSDNYPELLRQLPDPPPLLFACGDTELLQLPQLALVGSRNPTPGGEKTARQFARYLAGRGLIINSGLAYGIDGAAHLGALDGAGRTISVMGTGADRIYPARHRDLAHRIVAQGGCLISELPLGSSPMAANFPRRNRIISGLSLGVLVVEAALNSGSLITARLASEQGREVFAIPGSIHNSQARGCHALIKNGAKLVETADDIIEELAPLLGLLLPDGETEPEAKPAENTVEPVGDDHGRLLDKMGFDPVSVDELVQLTGLRVEEISSQLLLLELEGHVSSVPGGLYCRTN